MAHSLNKLEQNLVQILAHTKAHTKETLGTKTVTCEKHGAYESSGVRYLGTREVWSPCPDCVEDALSAERQAQAKEEADRRTRKIESMIEGAAIPARFIGRTFETFNASTSAQADALKVVKAYADDFKTHRTKGSGLILSGLPGTGKSHLAAATLQAIFPEHDGLYTTCMSFIRNIRCSWRRDSAVSERDVLETYRYVDLLVLDEIGVQYGTDGEQTILFDLLDGRYRDMMPTILITNQDKQGFKSYIGDRVFDRLVETSRWVPFDWPSYRPEARRATA